MSATMLPTEMLEFDPASHEDVIFKALRDGLTEDYYVFHSFRMNHVSLRWKSKPILWEKEIDFLVFHQKKGLLVLECKVNGRYVPGRGWCYLGHDESGQPRKMKHGGPFCQAQKAGKKLLEYLEDKSFDDGRSRATRDAVPSDDRRVINELCQIHYGVCFPAMAKADLARMVLPPSDDALKTITLCAEDLRGDSVKAAVDRLFSACSIEGGPLETNLSDPNARWLLEDVLYPLADVRMAPTEAGSDVISSIRYENLIAEQRKIMDFLIGERWAVVSGLAGTGKTYVAMEAIRQLCESLAESCLSARVLYLCFNAELCKFVRDEFSRSNPSLSRLADFKTVDGLACELMHASLPDGDDAKCGFYARAGERWLANRVYRHVVVDEAQDFSLPALQASGFGDSIMLSMSDASYEGVGVPPSFFAFYDLRQIVSGRMWKDRPLGLPAFIQEAECKMTLHKNCRNTRAIADAAARGVLQSSVPIIMASGASRGVEPSVVFAEQTDSVPATVRKMIQRFRKEGCSKVVVISCRSSGVGDKFSGSVISENNAITEKIADGRSYYFLDRVYPLSTYRRFKGLDADGVILVDVSKDSFIGPTDGMVYYEATSRAKKRLGIVLSMTDAECAEVIEHLRTLGRIPSTFKSLRTPQRTLLNALKAKQFI